MHQRSTIVFVDEPIISYLFCKYAEMYSAGQCVSRAIVRNALLYCTLYANHTEIERQTPTEDVRVERERVQQRKK